MYIEQVASRTVSLVAGCIFMIMGCIGKIAALFVTIPEPVLGGLFHVTLGKTYGLEEYTFNMCYAVTVWANTHIHLALLSTS